MFSSSEITRLINWTVSILHTSYVVLHVFSRSRVLAPRSDVSLRCRVFDSTLLTIVKHKIMCHRWQGYRMIFRQNAQAYETGRHWRSNCLSSGALDKGTRYRPHVVGFHFSCSGTPSLCYIRHENVFPRFAPASCV